MSVSLQLLLLAWPQARQWAAPLRHAVFVREQGVPEELEWDAQDADSLHAVILNEGTCLGTARLLPLEPGGQASIGRMAVSLEWRHQGLGSLLLRGLLEAAEWRNASQIVLHAQISAVDFYRRFGFIVIGPEFQEAGIPHLEMRLALDRMLKT